MHVPVLVVGAGPVGLAAGLDLGWRGIDCLVIDRTMDRDAAIHAHPRAAAVTPRTMEFCRRWGLNQDVHHSGFPLDFTPNVVYCTDLQGPTVMVQHFASIKDRKPLKESPELRQRCPQMWFDPILERGLAKYPSVRFRRGWNLDSFEQDQQCVVARITDLDHGAHISVTCDYMIACDGPVSAVREALGITTIGKGILSHSMNALVEIPDFLSRHDKGAAERYMFLDPRGVWCNLTVVDGRDRWRFGYAGSEAELDRASVDIPAMLRKVLGPGVPFEVLALIPWRRRESVAERFQSGRVFLAGDAAHTIPPNLGMGMNTGMGDCVDLGWKIEAALKGWAGPRLLASYEIERRPVAVTTSELSTRAFKTWMSSTDEYKDIALPGAAGDKARAGARAFLQKVLPDGWDSLGLQLGYRYDDSPICVADGTPPPPSDGRLSTYIQTSRPGARAPHAWLPDGRSTLDLYGRGFVLLRLGDAAIDVAAFTGAAAACGMPLSLVDIEDKDIGQLYEKKLVMVRPDGHVAWRGDAVPENAATIIDRIRGA